jgi:2-keto-4-pentenoate hydratase
MSAPHVASDAVLPAYLAPLRDALIAARRSRTPVAVAGLPEPRNDADAYAVQRAVADEFGWFATRPTAWKVGASSRTATPNAAPLPSAGVHSSPARFARGTFNRMLIEGEIAFRLRAPLRADVREADDALVSAAIGELVVTIEVVDPRYRDLDAASPALKLADQGLHGALVLGGGIAWRGSLAWESQVAIVRRDGEIVKETRGGHPLGDLRFMLSWLAQHAAERGTTLATGDVITAGTWTGVFEAGPAQVIDVEFPGIGRATARFD